MAQFVRHRGHQRQWIFELRTSDRNYARLRSTITTLGTSVLHRMYVEAGSTFSAVIAPRRKDIFQFFCLIWKDLELDFTSIHIHIVADTAEEFLRRVVRFV